MMPVSNPSSRTAPRDSLASGLVEVRVAHDAALAHLAPAGFKLRFD